MSFRWTVVVRALVLTIVACSSRPAQQATQRPMPASSSVAASGLDANVPVTETSATAAYDGKAWSECARQWLELASQLQDRTHRKYRDALYYAACCHALDGKLEPAFESLDAAIAAGFLNITHLETDPDLDSLRADPRWHQRIVDTEALLGAPALRRELLALADEDKSARDAWIASIEAKKPPAEESGLLAKVVAVDQKSTRVLKAVIAKHGWPGNRLVGDDGAAAAWLLVQHADRDRALQVDVLARMKPMVESGEVQARHYAYLYDRIAVAEKRPQLYGTQLDGNKPFPIEDEANVESRRAAVGLPSLADYLASQRNQQ